MREDWLVAMKSSTANHLFLARGKTTLSKRVCVRASVLISGRVVRLIQEVYLQNSQSAQGK